MTTGTRTAARERAARAYDCPTCQRPTGRRCTVPGSGRLRESHPARLALLDADLADVPTCPSTSPESHTPCVLPDHPALHYFGHEADHPTGAGSVSWSTTAADKTRWEPRP